MSSRVVVPLVLLIAIFFLIPGSGNDTAQTPAPATTDAPVVPETPAAPTTPAPAPAPAAPAGGTTGTTTP